MFRPPSPEHNTDPSSPASALPFPPTRSASRAPESSPASAAPTPHLLSQIRRGPRAPGVGEEEVAARGASARPRGDAMELLLKQQQPQCGRRRQAMTMSTTRGRQAAVAAMDLIILPDDLLIILNFS